MVSVTDWRAVGVVVDGVAVRIVGPEGCQISVTVVVSVRSRTPLPLKSAQTVTVSSWLLPEAAVSVMAQLARPFWSVVVRMAGAPAFGPALTLHSSGKPAIGPKALRAVTCSV